MLVLVEVYNFEQLLATANVALSSGAGPHLMYYGTGSRGGGLLADEGLLVRLDDYASQYGWNERIFEYERKRGTFDGTLYGLNYELEFLSMFSSQTSIKRCLNREA